MEFEIVDYEPGRSPGCSKMSAQDDIYPEEVNKFGFELQNTSMKKKR